MRKTLEKSIQFQIWEFFYFGGDYKLLILVFEY